MNVATAAALLNAWVDAGEGDLPFVVATADSGDTYALEEVADIAPITSTPPKIKGGIWLDEAEPGKPHTAIAAV